MPSSSPPWRRSRGGRARSCQFRRTAAVDVELHGQVIRAGDPVAFLYASANFDPDAFPDPYRFDLTRSPNHHLSYGTGPHLCMRRGGARLETRILFEELLARTSEIGARRTDRLQPRQLPARREAAARHDASGVADHPGS